MTARRSFLINAVSARIGGGVTTIRCLAEAIAERGPDVDVTVLCRASLAPSLADLHRENLRVEGIRTGEASVLLRVLWEQVQLPRRYARSDRIPTLLSPSNLGIQRWPGKQILLIQSIAPFDPATRTRGGLRSRLRYQALFRMGRQAFDYADAVVVNSFATEAVLKEAGCPPGKIVRIPLGLDASFRPQEDEIAGGYLLTVGAAYRHKNLETLLRAMAILRDRGVQHLLRIVGPWPDPEYARELMALRAALELDELVEFSGPHPYPSLPSIYAQALCFVLP